MTETTVECHSGYAYAQRPVAFEWEGQKLEIETIVAEWQTPEGKYFRVEINDQRNFELFYDPFQERWNIIPK